MEPGDLDKELDRIWGQAQGETPGPASPPVFQAWDSDLFSSQQEVAQETIRFLKAQYKEELLNLQDLLELKEKTIGELGARKESLERELAELKAHLQEGQEASLKGVVDAAARLKESRDILASQKEMHEKEVRLLQQLLEKTRQDLSREEARRGNLEQDWREKGKKYQEGLRRLSDLEQSRQKTQQDLRQAKQAVEKTLGELLAERGARADLEKAQRKAAEEAQSLEEELKASRAAWEAERTQWKDLWERERSTWEAQRQEFAQWEERLRKEREEWSLKIRAEEEKEAQYASRLTGVLKEASEWSSRVTSLLKLFATQGVKIPFFSQETLPQVARRGYRRILWAGSVVALVLGAGLYGVWIYWNRVHLADLASYDLPAGAPTGLALAGDILWVSDWERGVLSWHVGSFSERPNALDLEKIKPYHPGALALGGDSLWSLDAAQARVVRHPLANPEQVYSLSAPGSAPTALAYNESGLWVYDASSRLLYLLGLEPGGGAQAAFRMPPGIALISCLQWVGNDLWGLEEKSQRLLRFVLRNGAVAVRSSQRLSVHASAFSVQGNIFWALVPQPGRGYQLKKYRIR